MPAVNTLHREYAEKLPWWRRCRDCYDGGDAVRGRGEEYLPRLDSQTDPDPVSDEAYERYAKRALFYEGFSRTVDGLSGLVFQKPPEVKSKAVEEHLEDVTQDGESLETFALHALREVLTTGWGGILIEMPPEEPTPAQPPITGEGEQSVEDTAPKEIRPYWASRRREQVTNWWVERRKGDEKLMRVVFEEQHEKPDPEDDFKVEVETKYRVLDVTGGAYEQVLYRKVDDKKDEWVEETRTTPKRRGKALDFIPFVPFGPTSVSMRPAKPPLLGLADANLHHFYLMAHLGHGLHWTALPTPYVAGLAKDDGSPIPWGGSKTIILREGGQIGLVEFKGGGLASIEKAEEQTRKLMATLGARLLEEQPGVAETMGAVAMRHSAEHANLRTIVQTLEAALTLALKIHAWWVGTEAAPADVDAKVELNKEFFAVTITEGELRSFIEAVQAGEMSSETLYFNMVRGGITRPGITYEEERKLIKQRQEERAKLTPPELRPGAPPEGGGRPPQPPPNAGAAGE